jgi:hypothetical protein
MKRSAIILAVPLFLWTSFSSAEPAANASRDRQAYDRIAAECGVSTSVFVLVGDDEIHFRPSPDDRYESVDCVLRKVRSAGLAVGNMGFVGNEAPAASAETRIRVLTRSELPASTDENSYQVFEISSDRADAEPTASINAYLASIQLPSVACILEDRFLSLGRFIILSPRPAPVAAPTGQGWHLSSIDDSVAAEVYLHACLQPNSEQES